jgi:hypothetical protein
MAKIWHWFVLNSATLAICVGGALAALLWLFPNRKEWGAGRQEKANFKTDFRVYEALGNRSLWKGARPKNGAGFPQVRCDEIAEYLKLDAKVVNDSLDRLVAQGGAIKQDGTFSDARPRWIYLPR